MKRTSHDVILFGATSFVGQILARYMLATFGASQTKKDGLRWAMAGRSQAKLETLRASLGTEAAQIDLFVADAADSSALTALCGRTRVVVSTVGPYALFGEPLVKACAETGTDYCDLTGEVQWIRRMVMAYADIARNSGARIVHCCGFDSIPSDLGVWHLQQAAQTQFGAPAVEVKMRVKAMKGGASGGTVASLMNVVKEAVADSALRKELANPYSICPPDYVNKTRQKNLKTAEFDSDLNAWTAPFVMAAINTRVVLRSNALLGNRYGADFKYDEAMITGRGLKGRMTALGLVGGLGGFMAASALPPGRWALEKFVVPAPGEGPTPAQQEKGFFDLRFVGKTGKGDTVRTKVTGDRDPGYGSTAKMLGQAAACLAQDIGPADAAGGFWTPASIFGDKLVARLQAHSGLKFEVLAK
jgi:short subunit dehydrogenase-like uncharacterized protein